MASRNEAEAANKPVVLTNPQSSTSAYGGGGGGGGGGSGSSSSFAGIENPEAIAILLDYIQKAQGGGSEDYKKQRAERQTQIGQTRALAGDYTKAAAFNDAIDLMAQQLRISLEKNMPAIAKSVQGAGTSASSMQGLLSQKLATESAQAAGALGAEQAKAYGSISAQLQSVLEGLTRIDTQAEQNLINALNTAKVQRSSESHFTNPTNPTAPTYPGQSSGGGSYIAYPQSQASLPTNAFAPVNTGTVSNNNAEPGYGYVVNTTAGVGNVFQNGEMQSFNYAPAAYEPVFGLEELDQQYAEGWGYGD